MIIAIYSGKGGVGKSTTAATLACMNREEEPLLLDMDEQKATLAFHDSLAGIERRDVTPSQLGDVLDQNQGRLILIDTPPLWQFAYGAIERAGLVIVPCATELLPFRATIASFNSVSRLDGNRIVKVLLTRYNVFESEARQVRDESSEAFSDQVFKSKIPSSREVREALLEGKCVTEFAPTGRAAVAYQTFNEEIKILRR